MMHLPRIARSPLAHLLRSLPLRGRWRIAPRLNRLFKAEPVEVCLTDVGRVRLDLSDEDQLQIYWTGLHPDDVRIIRLMQATLPTDGIFLDVGANVGIHALAAARRVASGGAVVAFEPHPQNFRTLRHNLDQNGLHHVMAHNVGLAEEADLIVCRGEEKGGNWSLASRGEHRFEVRLISLDDYLRQHPLPRIDLMKIDVEGAEVRVLQGARATIARFRPMIIFEVCPAWLHRLKTSNAELLVTLEGLGYTIHPFSAQGRVERTQRIVAADLAGMNSGDWMNLVAVPAGPVEELSGNLTAQQCRTVHLGV